MRRRLLAGLVLWIHAAPASAQCVMCRTALATPEGQALIAGFQSGILLLVALPFVALGTIGFLAVRGQRRLTSPATDPAALTS